MTLLRAILRQRQATPLKNYIKATASTIPPRSFATFPNPHSREKPAFTPPTKEELELQRKTYKSELSVLRKKYLSDHTAATKRDRAAELEKNAKIQAAKAQRQYRKNLRSVANAKKDQSRKASSAVEFERHLEREQAKREIKKERFRKARQMLISELEAEAPLWICSAEEIEEKIDGVENSNELWTKPGSFIGVVPEDATFWRFQSHTMDMSRTYQTEEEEYAERKDEVDFLKGEIDMTYWTPERIYETKDLEKKTRLRAMVRKEGRRILLDKQASWMKETFDKKDREDEGDVRVPLKIPPSSLSVLGNERAMAEAGGSAILENVDQFLEGTGRGVALKQDPEDGPYEKIYGVELTDDRTAKEKKRDERQMQLDLANEKSKGTQKSDEEFESTLEDDGNQKGPYIPPDVAAEQKQKLTTKNDDAVPVIPEMQTDAEIEAILKQIEKEMDQTKTAMKKETDNATIHQSRIPDDVQVKEIIETPAFTEYRLEDEDNDDQKGLDEFSAQLATPPSQFKENELSSKEQEEVNAKFEEALQIIETLTPEQTQILEGIKAEEGQFNVDKMGEYVVALTAGMREANLTEEQIDILVPAEIMLMGQNDSSESGDTDTEKDGEKVDKTDKKD